VLANNNKSRHGKAIQTIQDAEADSWCLKQP